MKRFYKRRYRMIARVVWQYCRQGMGRFKGAWKKIYHDKRTGNRKAKKAQ